MAQITRYPGVRFLRADASGYIQQFQKGERVRAGKGLSFWFAPGASTFTEIPMADRITRVLLKGQSQDYQEVAVQGSIIWRVADPERLGDRVDFSIDEVVGSLKTAPLDQINDLIGTLGRRIIAAHLQNNGIRALLEAGLAPLQTALRAGFAADDTMPAMGIEIVGVGVDQIAPSSELARALQAPTFESLQQQADQATFARRALAVEKERAIAENELHTKIELESRRKQLIAREDENARAKASAEAAAQTIRAEAEAQAQTIRADAKASEIRAVDQARADMEKERLAAYASLPPMVLFGMAAQDFAQKLDRIDNLTVSPDMLAGALAQIRALAANGSATPKQDAS